jgi:hypothetical protein
MSVLRQWKEVMRGYGVKTMEDVPVHWHTNIAKGYVREHISLRYD